MPITYSIDSGGRVAIVRISGDLTVDDFARYFAESAGDPQFHMAMDRLVVVEQLKSFPAASEVMEVAGHIAQRTREPSVRFAVVVDSPLGRGMAAMFLGNAGMADRYEAFTDVTTAMKWLLTSRAKARATPEG